VWGKREKNRGGIRSQIGSQKGKEKVSKLVKREIR
jgi:hypothetical protein